ncbi:MAG: hypothetical protein HQ523_04075 [Lentisphaerae bacterium]|nr:hypothetical protein [Lentisphaerota bacterium]
MTSIRRQLVLRILGGTLLLLVAASAFLGFTIRALDVHEFDATMTAKARLLANLLERQGRYIEAEFEGAYLPEFEAGTGNEYFQCRFMDGALIERSGTLGARELPSLPSPYGGIAHGDLVLPDGRKGRIVQLVLPPRTEEDEGLAMEGDDGQPFFEIPSTLDPEAVLIVVSYACSREELDGLIRSVFVALTGVIIVLVLLIGLMVSRSLHKGFEPIAAMNAQIEALDLRTLEQRIDLANTPTELKPVLTALNDFIDRLQSAFARERRFSSDVAHELRTPVAEFRTACEVGAKWADDSALVARQFQGMLESSISMERIVDSLLRLSRCDAGMVTPQPVAIHIAALADDCWSSIANEANLKHLPWVNELDPKLVVYTDVDSLHIIFHNLLSNAVSYSLPDRPVVCRSKEAHDGLRVSFANNTSGLLPEDLKHLFERFWRKDTARSGGRHSGLGLALVESLAGVLNIRTEVTLTPEGVFTFTLTIPPLTTA